jgi:uncharacterized membrane protein
MNKITNVILGIIVITISSWNVKEDVIPNEAAAIEIAEKEWLAQFGENVFTTKPYKAILEKDSIWHVFGTLKPIHRSINENGDTIISVNIGGVPHIFLNKRNGKILNCYHTK